MAWSSPRTWVTNEIVTAAQLNQEIRDNLGCFTSMIAYTDGALLSGWADYTSTLGGRYVVATPTSGSTTGTVGTALSNKENRETGTHNHTITDPGHAHTENAYYSTGIDVANIFGTTPADTTPMPTTLSSTTGISLATSGSVAGTNAPYMQLLAMKKSA